MKSLAIRTGCFVLAGLFVSCSDCNDCLDVQQKDILIQDSNGNNLLFGTNAIFDPEKVTLSSGGETAQPLFIDRDTQTLQFSLNDGVTTYTLRLDDDNTETIVFELGERNSDRCCGNQVFSMATQLNGAGIANNDVISIIK
ncbi:MAG: hypothetical protein AAF039_09065 [Bacteroidota bacterium]